MSIEWFRWYHGTVSNPKLALIAKKSGQSRPVTIAVWAALLEHASKSDIRGDVSNFDVEIIAVALDIEEDAINAVIAAMNAKGMIVDRTIAKWEARQPQREDASTERVRAFREKQKPNVTHGNAVKRDETHGNAPVTHGNAVKRDETHGNAPVTHGNAMKRDETHGNAPVTHGNAPDKEEIREEIREETKEEKRVAFAPLAAALPEVPPVPDPEPVPEPATRSTPKAAKATKTTKAVIRPDWQPADGTYAMLESLGIDRPFAQRCVAEFVLYWTERGELRPGWEASFVNSVKRTWEKRPPTADPAPDRVGVGSDRVKGRTVLEEAMARHRLFQKLHPDDPNEFNPFAASLRLPTDPGRLLEGTNHAH
jgi:hypothetical protein